LGSRSPRGPGVGAGLRRRTVFPCHNHRGGTVVDDLCWCPRMLIHARRNCTTRQTRVLRHLP
jgi:hypothetical protein